MTTRTHTPTPASQALDGPGVRGLDPPAGPALDALLQSALDEDRASEDVTSLACIAAQGRARATLVAKQPGVLAGLSVFARVFALVDAEVACVLHHGDGDRVERGALCAELEGSARALLAGERTALNLLQRMSGVATLTARYVDAAAGGARILDMRKTTPGLRALEKYSVRCGGGHNHRFDLADQAMVKDNHIDFARVERFVDGGAAELVDAMRALGGADLIITIEARDREQALAAAAAGADVVLLDNMSDEAMASLCPEVRAAAQASPRGRNELELEASGGIDLARVAAVARTGVDRISVGALTHSAPALELSLRMEAAE